jgi:hypothetical protein
MKCRQVHPIQNGHFFHIDISLFGSSSPQLRRPITVGCVHFRWTVPRYFSMCSTSTVTYLAKDIHSLTSTFDTDTRRSVLSVYFCQCPQGARDQRFSPTGKARVRTSCRCFVHGLDGRRMVADLSDMTYEETVLRMVCLA